MHQDQDHRYMQHTYICMYICTWMHACTCIRVKERGSKTYASKILASNTLALKSRIRDICNYIHRGNMHHRCIWVGHTAWAPKGRKVGARSASRLLETYIFTKYFLSEISWMEYSVVDNHDDSKNPDYCRRWWHWTDGGWWAVCVTEMGRNGRIGECMRTHDELL